MTVYDLIDSLNELLEKNPNAGVLDVVVGFGYRNVEIVNTVDALSQATMNKRDFVAINAVRDLSGALFVAGNRCVPYEKRCTDEFWREYAENLVHHHVQAMLDDMAVLYPDGGELVCDREKDYYDRWFLSYGKWQLEQIARVYGTKMSLEVEKRVKELFDEAVMKKYGIKGKLAE